MVFMWKCRKSKRGSAGTIPHKRDNIEADGFKFTVMEVKDQRILRVVVKKNDTSEENESDEKSDNKKSE